MNNSRINAIEQIEANLRNLEAYGYNTSHVWAEHNAWLLTLDTRQPTPFDATWATRNEQPSSIEDHFIQLLKFPVYANAAQEGDAPVGWEEKRQYEPELLRAANAFADRHFTLTPGQRDVLRERHGLTPARHIIIVNVQTFPGTNLIASFTIKSAEHIDPRRRRHVLVEAVIINAAQFFQLGKARDDEREVAKAETDTKRVKKGEEPRSAKQKALRYFE